MPAARRQARAAPAGYVADRDTVISSNDCTAPDDHGATQTAKGRSPSTRQTPSAAHLTVPTTAARKCADTATADSQERSHEAAQVQVHKETRRLRNSLLEVVATTFGRTSESDN